MILSPGGRYIYRKYNLKDYSSSGGAAFKICRSSGAFNIEIAQIL